MKNLIKISVPCIITAAMFFSLSKNAFSIENSANDYYSLQDIVISEVATDQIPYEPSNNTSIVEEALPSMDQIVMAKDMLVAVGSKTWEIVKAGKPVVNTNLPAISILPEEKGKSVAAFEMENWSTPRKVDYQIAYRNNLNMNVVTFAFSVIYQYGGSYKGHGKYLASINIVPKDVTVAWGYTFSATSTLLAITNKGTKQNPIASATLAISHRVTTPLMDTSKAVSIHISADGTIKKL